nr:MAG TPA: hypothetical protein [Caudoviricetes sp.]
MKIWSKKEKFRFGNFVCETRAWCLPFYARLCENFTRHRRRKKYFNKSRLA